MISNTIGIKITDALRARDEIRLSTLKLLSTSLSYEKIAKQRELSAEEEIMIVRREIKKREEAIEYYKRAQATDRVETEQKEIEILQEFLPE
ncbi:MAG: GatB/YqeY domain-containing protein [Patescibacteria group bacterium]